MANFNDMQMTFIDEKLHPLVGSIYTSLWSSGDKFTLALLATSEQQTSC